MCVFFFHWHQKVQVALYLTSQWHFNDVIVTHTHTLIHTHTHPNTHTPTPPHTPHHTHTHTHPWLKYTRSFHSFIPIYSIFHSRSFYNNVAVELTWVIVKKQKTNKQTNKLTTQQTNKTKEKTNKQTSKQTKTKQKKKQCRTHHANRPCRI